MTDYTEGDVHLSKLLSGLNAVLVNQNEKSNSNGNTKLWNVKI